MNTLGQNREVIAEISAGDKTDEWTLQYLNEVYYFQGYAFAELRWIKNQTTAQGTVTILDGGQLIAVNLDDGSVVDLTGILQYEKEYLKLSYVLFGGQKALYVRESFKEPMLSEDEYYMNNPKGDYALYVNDFRINTPQRAEYRMFSFDTRENRLIWTGDCDLYTDADGRGTFYKCPFQFCGSVDGRWLTFRYDNQTVEYSWSDVDTGAFVPFWSRDTDGEKEVLGKGNGKDTYFIVKKSDFEVDGMKRATEIYL